jgi:hypothetical protein
MHRHVILIWCCTAQKKSHARNLSCWPTFPISINYRNTNEDKESDIALLKHRDRVRSIFLEVPGRLDYEKVLAAMKEPFPVLTFLGIHVRGHTGYHSFPPVNSSSWVDLPPSLQHVLLFGHSTCGFTNSSFVVS